MAAMITTKQRAAIEAMEAARSQGCTLNAYARMHGLDAQRIYAMLSSLRKRGVLPRAGGGRSSRFVAVKLQGPVAPLSTALNSSGVVCRVVCGGRYVIECLQWPSASWLKSLGEGTADAAA